MSFLGEGVEATVRLAEDLAPSTCAAVWEALPIGGTSHHGVYSGSECVLLLPEVMRLPPENATSEVAKGDVGFVWLAEGSAYGVDRDLAEICWFYDEDACPSMHGGPVPVSIFGRIEGDAEAFFAVCRRMRREGVKTLVIERVESGPVEIESHQVVFRVPSLIATEPVCVSSATEQPRIAFGVRTPLGGCTQHTASLIDGRWTVDGGADERVTADQRGPIEVDENLLIRAERATEAILCAMSHDAGTTWEQVVLRPLPGCDPGDPVLVRLPEDRFLCAYTAWDGPADGSPPGRARAVHATTFRIRR